jgi:hypothetical protein
VAEGTRIEGTEKEENEETFKQGEDEYEEKLG